jgi:MEDS: MEthanogen/methylotroph, DcmR Sensory domain
VAITVKSAIGKHEISLTSYSLADPRDKMTSRSNGTSEVTKNSHLFFQFNNSEEKQQKIFALVVRLLARSTIMYIAGKQGIKGIRLSMKDYGIDVAANERENRLKIVDSEDYFLTKNRQPSFKPIDDIQRELENFEASASRGNFEFSTIVCETDMLVRKGFFENYLEFEKQLPTIMTNGAWAVVCIYDERELQAKGLTGLESKLIALHSAVLNS